MTTATSTSELIAIPATIIRGGTSRGVFLLESDLPQDRSLWGPFIMSLFGSRDARQIDGIGGAMPTTSKCCIVGASRQADADVDYTFAQVGIGEEKVYWDFNCGNLTPSVGTFAVLAGLVKPTPGVTVVRIYQTNTRTYLKVEVPTADDGTPLVEGPLAIAGVSGTGAATLTDMSSAIGASLGRGLLPTGHTRDVINVPNLGEIECSIVDIANMCVFFRAEDAGLTGLEMPVDGPRVVERFIAVRRASQALLGVDPAKTTPWPVAISSPREYVALGGQTVDADSYDFAVRFAGIQPMRDTLHEAYPGTASCCTAVAAILDGSIANEHYARRPHDDVQIEIGHPSGVMQVEAKVRRGGDGYAVERATFGRTVRLIMRGEAYVRRADVERLAHSIDVNDPTRKGPLALVAASGHSCRPENGRALL